MAQHISTAEEFKAFTAEHLGPDGSWREADLRVEAVGADGFPPDDFAEEPGLLRLKVSRYGNDALGAVSTCLATVDLGVVLDAAAGRS